MPYKNLTMKFKGLANQIIKLALLMLLMFNVQFTVYGQIAYSESFDGANFLPPGWTSVGTTNLWTRRTTGTFPTCNNHSGAGMLRYGARGAAAKTIQTIASPVFDLSNKGANAPKISLWIYRDNGSTLGDSLSVYVNTSATLNAAKCIGTIARYSKLKMPDTVAVNGWYNYTFIIPSSFSSSTNYFLLKGIGEAGYNIHIDDIQWEGFPNLCSGQPAAGTISATNSIICNGGGATILSLSGQTTGFAGITFQWKSSTSATGPFNNFGGNVSTISTGAISASTFYKCVASCSYSGQSDSSAVKLIKVNPNPNPVVTVNPNTANYCQGSKVGVALQANSTTAKTYTWSPSLGLNRSDTSLVTASPNITTNYVVSGTDSVGCTGAMNVTVTLRQPPFVSITVIDTNLCVGDSMRITATAGGGGNTFLWAPNGETLNFIYAKPNVSTDYSVTVKNTFGCSTVQSKKMRVAQKPKANFSYKINGRKLNFFDSSINTLNYEWEFGDGNGSKKSNPTYVFAEDGTYYVTLIVNNSPCDADTLTKLLTVSLANINLINPNACISFGPNPVENKLSIHSVSNTKPYLTLINMLGEIVYQAQMTSNTETIEMYSLKAGVYYLTAQNNESKSVFKLIKI